VADLGEVFGAAEHTTSEPDCISLNKIL
jgi:hypothetical protein